MNADFQDKKTAEVKMAKGLSRNDLCVLSFLHFHPFVFNPEELKGKEEFISME